MGTADGPASLFHSAHPQTNLSFSETFSTEITLLDCHQGFRPLDLYEELEGNSLERRKKKVLEVCKKAEEITKKTLEKNQFPLIFGGDHSLAMGTWSGVKSAKNDDFGLIWIDAHLDAHTQQTSPSHAFHGMPVANLLGYEAESTFPPILKPENLFYIAARSFESEEISFLDQHNVKIFYMEDIRRQSFSAIFDEIQQYFSDHSLPYGISFDVDAMDPKEAPGTGVPEENGLLGAEIFPSLQGILHDPRLLAFEILEFNPYLDQDDKTVDFLWKLTETLVGDKNDT